MPKTRQAPWTLLLISACLTGCVPSTATPQAALVPSPSAPAESSTRTPAVATAATVAGSQLLPGGLRLEEHLLLAAPELDPLTFLPVSGTEDQVLSRHAAERAQALPSRLFFEDGSPCLWAPWDGDQLVARLRAADEDPLEQIVELWQGDTLLLTAPAGLPSPALPLQGLWTYDGHWALEILLATPEIWAGQVFLDGELLNQTERYEEAFSFQLLAGKPFYLYQRDGKIGLSYDGQEIDLGYSQVPHYQCCSGSVLNPLQAEKMVAFFAERDGIWRYVEVGLFE